MDRRSYIQGVGAISIGTGLIGCLNIPESGSADTGDQGYQDRLDESRTAGDRVTADSLAVTVGDIATRVEHRLEDGDTAETVPTAGGQWFLCQIIVEQLDTIRRDFPDPDESIQLFCEERDTASQFFPTDSLIMNEETYVPFELILNQRKIPFKRCVSRCRSDGVACIRDPRRIRAITGNDQCHLGARCRPRDSILDI